MNLKNTTLHFTVIVIVNVFFKILYLDNTPFSFDEIISVKNTLLDFGHIKHEAEWDNNPPFYYYCLWVWNHIFPVGEFSSRFLSVIFVSIAIGLTFIFSNKYFGFRTAIFTVILLSLSNFITFYAQETRAYSLVLMLSMISTIYFFKYLESKKNTHLLVLVLINFLIIYTHYIAGLIIIFQFINVFIFRKDIFKKYSLINTSLILGLVLLRFTKKQFLNILNYNKKDDFWLKPATYHDLLEAISQLFFNKIIGTIFFCCLLVFIIQFRKSRQDKKFNIEIYLLSLGFFSILILFLIGTFKAIFLARYLIFSLPFATIFVVNTLLRIKLFGLIGICLIIASSILSVNIYKESGMDYKTIASLTKDLKKENDLVVINKRDNLALFEFYYNNENFLKFKNFDSLAQTQNIYGMNEIESLKSLPLKTNSRIFLFQSFHKINSSTNDFVNELSKSGAMVFHSNEIKGVELSVFKPYIK